MANFVDARSYTSSFSINQLGYVVGGAAVTRWDTNDCYQYDPLTNKWKNLSPIGYRPIERGFAFVNNGRAYSSSGTSSASNHELYEVYGNNIK
ncbi:kelch repeat-containing protein [Adhaeribacter arboris]|uniref:kelch repeat-containing protein n=1 Tax=Adhaeribacter arboris TaxID=2072846 RepID=UPI001304D9BB